MFDCLKNCSRKQKKNLAGDPEYIGYWKSAPNTAGAPDDDHACFAVVKITYDDDGDFESATVTRNSHGEIIFNNKFSDPAGLVYS